MKRVMLSVVVIALLGGASAGRCQRGYNPNRIETRLSRDSTLFSLILDSKSKPKAGKTFKARIHVTPHPGWRIWSAFMKADCCFMPLSVKIPSSLDSFFEVIKLEEVGEAIERYDSNFMSKTSAYYSPFDVIATIAVKANSATPIPFYVLVHFQTVNATQCMQPRTFAVPMEVLGEKPIELRITQGKVSKPKKATATTKATNVQSSLMKDFEPFGVTNNSENNFWDSMSVLNVGRDAS